MLNNLRLTYVVWLKKLITNFKYHSEIESQTLHKNIYWEARIKFTVFIEEGYIHL